MEIHLTRDKTVILYAFKDISNDFVADDSGNLYAFLKATSSGYSDEETKRAREKEMEIWWKE